MMDGEKRGFYINAWGAAGLTAVYQICTSLIFFAFQLPPGRRNIFFENPIFAWVLLLVFHLCLFSGCLSLATIRKESRQWLITRTIIIIFTMLMLVQVKDNFINWLNSMKSYNVFLIYNLLSVLYLVAFVGMPFLLFPSKDYRHNTKPDQRIPLMVIQKPISIRLWFIFLMVFVAPIVIGFPFHLAEYLARRNWHLLDYIGYSTIPKTIRWSFIAYMLTCLAEYSLARRDLKEQPMEAPVVIHTMKTGLIDWQISLMAAVITAIIAWVSMNFTDWSRVYPWSYLFASSPLTAMAALSGCFWLGRKNPAWRRWLLGIVLVGLAGSMLGWLVAYQAAWIIADRRYTFQFLPFLMNAAISLLPQAGLIAVLLLASKLHKDYLGRVPLFARKSFILSTIGMVTFSAMILLLVSSESIKDGLGSLADSISNQRNQWFVYMLREFRDQLKGIPRLIPALVWAFLAVYVTQLIAWKMTVFAPPKEAGLFRILMGQDKTLIAVDPKEHDAVDPNE